jgi:hypothetical protein
MASTATTRLRIEKQGTGENVNSWGAKLNATGLELFDSAIAGMVSFALSGSKTLTSSNYAADEARMAFMNITSGTGGTVTIPSVEKTYLVRNATSGTVTITTGSGATAVLQPGNMQYVGCDGTNVYAAIVTDYGSSQIFTTATPTLSTHVVNKAAMDAAILAASLSSDLPPQSAGFFKSDGTNLSFAPLTSGEVTTALTYTPTSITSYTGVQTLSGLKTAMLLANVDNTSDANKPVSTATATALAGKAATGLIASSGLTMNTARFLYRATASAGAVEEGDAAALRTFAGLVIGTNVQAFDADLTAIAGLTSAANKGIQFTGAGTAATYDLTTAGKALLDDADAAAQRVTLSISAKCINLVFDGGGAAITTGVKFPVKMPHAGTITSWDILPDQSGSIVFDIWKDTYANYPPTIADTITASAKPTLSAATKAQSSTLTGWTTSFAAGDILLFNVDSASTVTKVTLVLNYTQ